MKNVFSKVILFAVLTVFYGSVAVGSDLETKRRARKEDARNLARGAGFFAGGFGGFVLGAAVVIRTLPVDVSPNADYLSLLAYCTKVGIMLTFPAAGAYGGTEAVNALGRMLY